MVTEMTNMLVGMQTSPPSAQQGKTGPMWIKCNFDNNYYDMTADFLNILYNLPDTHSNRGFSEDLTDLGDFYQSSGGTIANTGDKNIIADPLNNRTDANHYTDNNYYPYFKPAYGGNCQQSFALVLTDGASPSTANIKNYDMEGGEYDSIYDGGVFGDNFNKTAGDAGMQYYEQDLRT